MSNQVVSFARRWRDFDAQPLWFRAMMPLVLGAAVWLTLAAFYWVALR